MFSVLYWFELFCCVKYYIVFWTLEILQLSHCSATYAQLMRTHLFCRHKQQTRSRTHLRRRKQETQGTHTRARFFVAVCAGALGFCRTVCAQVL